MYEIHSDRKNGNRLKNDETISKVDKQQGNCKSIEKLRKTILKVDNNTSFLPNFLK